MHRRRVLWGVALASPLLLLLRAGVRRYACALLSRALPELTEPRLSGTAFLRTRPADLAVVIDDPSLPDDPASFDETDWAWAWCVTLEAWGGGCAVVAPENVPDALQGCRLVVLPRALCGRHLPHAALETWVRHGGVLVVEGPSPLLALGGMSAASSARPASHVTSVANLPPTVALRMKGAPVRTVRFALSLPGGARTLLWLDGAPAAALVTVGRGAVLGLGCDFGAMLTAWRQGVPGVHFAVRERAGAVPLVVEADDLVGFPSMLRNPTPFADLVVRALLGAAADAVRLPRWWPIPDGAPAGYVATHDDEGCGRASLERVLALDREAGLRPTVFAIADGNVGRRWARARTAGTSPGADARAGGAGPSPIDLQCHWNRYVASDLRRHTLRGQLRFLRTVAPEASMTRLHYLDWGEAWDAP